MSGKYILDGHTPVLCDSILEWGQWFETADRHVAKTTVQVDGEDINISTVFLGLDHSFDTGEPVLFETMVFGGKHDQEMDRYSTWNAAMTGHTAMVAKAVKS